MEERQFLRLTSSIILPFPIWRAKSENRSRRIVFQKSGRKITITLSRNYSSMDCLDLSRFRRTTLFELKLCKEYAFLFPSSTKQNRYLCCAKVFNDLLFLLELLCLLKGDLNLTYENDAGIYF